jgi:uncharacterized protein YbbK (DUF523 family)
MEKILISSCLLGDPVRYDGRGAKIENVILNRWVAEGRIVSVCPEIRGGLSVPRAPAEIIGVNGFAVLDGFGAVLDSRGNDLTRPLLEGANKVLQLARSLGVKVAMLKDGSPSCGRTFIHNGQFRGLKKRGEVGVTSALLQRNGIGVFSEHQIVEAERRLAELELLCSK